MKKEYITFAHIRNFAFNYYNKYHTSVSFTRALNSLIEQEMLVECDEPDVMNSNTLMSSAEFRSFIDRIPVEAVTILSNPSRDNISEDFSIPYKRDVVAFVPMPHVDDGIHFHNYFEVNYTYSGQAVLQIGSESHVMKNGEICIVSPNTSHNFLIDTENGFAVSLMVRKSTFDNIFGSILIVDDLLALFFQNTLYSSEQSHYLLFKTEANDENIIRLVQRIVIESHSSRKYSNAVVNCLMQEFFYTLMREYSNTVSYYGMKNKFYSQHQFSMILAYVQSQYATATLKSVANFFNYSESYLSKLFKKNLNQNFNQVLQNLKVGKAREYLIETDMSIAEITEKVGYDSTDYFTKNYKKHFGYTPSEFRKHVRDKNSRV